jgi:hypothetical protein
VIFFVDFQLEWIYKSAIRLATWRFGSWIEPGRLPAGTAGMARLCPDPFAPNKSRRWLQLGDYG